MEICITGIGLITSIGNNLNENIVALKEGKTGIGKAQFVKSKYTDLMPFGEVGLSDGALAEELKVNGGKVSRTQMLAHKAFLEAMENSGVELKECNNAETSIVIASTVGGMYLTDELYADSNNLSHGSGFLSEYDCASIGIYMQKLTGVKGVVNTINTACSSGANALLYGYRLIQHGKAKRVIVGGVDCLSKFTINGFNSLNILSSTHCKPFDNSRDGLNLGEGAGFLILEPLSDANRNKTLSVLNGFGNANDAYHPSALSDDGYGPTAAIRNALSKASLQPEDIDSIIVHGTGTPNNDRVEGMTLKNIFKEDVPSFCSLKSVFGHTLGAASAIESVMAVCGVKNGYIYPSRNFQTADEVTKLTPNLKFKNSKIRHSLLNSFGFGGNCSSLIFSSIN